MSSNNVNSQIINLENLFLGSYSVDFYQREYVWKTKQIQDLITDLSNEFLSKYSKGDIPKSVGAYNEYFMGEIIICTKDNLNSIIDGQQRITSFMLLIIYILNTFKDVQGLPKSKLETLITKDVLGEIKFTLEVEERNACMQSLFYTGEYNAVDNNPSVNNIIGRYNDIKECWNPDINEDNIIVFTYWLLTNIVFSKVWTDKDTFAYVIFETMNDRGKPLTKDEMLKSYLLSNIKDEYKRNDAKDKFENIIPALKPFSVRGEIEFFKVLFRSNFAQSLSQSSNINSDFNFIGNGYHRWVRENAKEKLGLNISDDFYNFVKKICYYSKIYIDIQNNIKNRNSKDYFYLITNNDYGFTLQPALLLASISYNEDKETIKKKFDITTKFITYMLSSRIWSNDKISQSTMDNIIYPMCKEIRNKSIDELKVFFKLRIERFVYEGIPSYGKQNKRKIRTLLSLITNIVSRNSDDPDFDILKSKNIDIEHIWADKYEMFERYVDDEEEFKTIRNYIGDLLLLPSSFNRSLNDDSYEEKVKKYIEQNTLAQSLNSAKYVNNPNFRRFIENSQLGFTSYDEFERKCIFARTDLYKQILIWDMNKE